MSEENSKSPSKLKVYIRNTALIMLIFVMPLVSWYYLSSGLNYQKEARAELKEYAIFPKFDFQTQYGTNLTQDSLKRKISVIHFFSKQDKNVEETMEKLSLIYDQFKERNDVLFLNFCLDEEVAADFSFRTYGVEKKLNDLVQCFFLQRNDPTVSNLLLQNIQTPVAAKENPTDEFQLQATNLPKGESYPFLLLVDEHQIIRNYYQIEKDPAMGRLVEHMAMILPREKKEGTKMVRTREK
ncbi:MAG: hypothetical protein AB8G15_09325 [Saprospiraceae bacterium]